MYIENKFSLKYFTIFYFPRMATKFNNLKNILMFYNATVCDITTEINTFTSILPPFQRFILVIL